MKNIITRLVLIVFVALPATTFAQSVPLRIMAMGDSITEGYTPSGGIGGTPSYRKELHNLLSQTHCNFQMVGSKPTPADPWGQHEGYTAHYADWFISGSGPDGNQGITAQMAANDPDVVLMHLGSNDIRRGDPVGTAQDVNDTVGEINQIIGLIRTANPNAYIFVANVIPWWGGAFNNNVTADIATLGDQLTLLVDNLRQTDDNVFLVDVRNGFTQSDMQADLIHPNTSGENRIADAFADALDQSSACPPSTTITTPFSEGAVLNSALLAGEADDDANGTGIDTVWIAIENTDITGNNKWFNFNNGQFDDIGNGCCITDATFTSNSTGHADWEINLNPNNPLGHAPLPDGNYKMYALAIDNEGNDEYHGKGLALWPERRSFTLQVDSTKPTGDFDSPANNATVIGNNNFDITGNVWDTQSGVDRALVRLRRIESNGTVSYWSGSTWQSNPALFNVNFDSNGDFTISNTDLSTDGNYLLQINVRDNAGNTSSAADNGPHFFAVLSDSVKPTGNFYYPAKNAIVIATNSLNITGNVYDETSGVDRALVRLRRITTNGSVTYWNGSGWQNSPLLFPVNFNNSGNFTIPNVNLSADGNYLLQINVKDNAGNISSAADNGPHSFSVVSDVTKPTGSFDYPANNATVAATSSLNITGNVYDEISGVDRALVRLRRIRTNGSVSYWNGSGWQNSPTLFSESFDNEGDFTVSNTDISADGNYLLQINVKDNAGNISSAADNGPHFFSVGSDNTDPTGVFTNPSQSEIVLANPSVSITGIVWDDLSGVDRVLVRIRKVSSGVTSYWNGSAWQSNHIMNDTQFDSAGVFSESVDLSDPGNYVLQIYVKDKAGNVSTAAQNPSRQFSVTASS